jgi:hypothetical protein
MAFKMSRKRDVLKEHPGSVVEFGHPEAQQVYLMMRREHILAGNRHLRRFALQDGGSQKDTKSPSAISKAFSSLMGLIRRDNVQVSESGD